MAALVVGAVVALVAGWRPGAAAAVFGLLALGIQLLAARIARRMGVPATPDQPVTYAVGLLLRIAGVGLIWLAVMFDRAAFPVGACAAGYLGTLLPLLWLETRLT